MNLPFKLLLVETYSEFFACFRKFSRLIPIIMVTFMIMTTIEHFYPMDNFYVHLIFLFISTYLEAFILKCIVNKQEPQFKFFIPVIGRTETKYLFYELLLIILVIVTPVVFITILIFLQDNNSYLVFIKSLIFSTQYNNSYLDNIYLFILIFGSLASILLILLRLNLIFPYVLEDHDKHFFWKSVHSSWHTLRGNVIKLFLLNICFCIPFMPMSGLTYLIKDTHPFINFFIEAAMFYCQTLLYALLLSKIYLRCRDTFLDRLSA